jgi:trehalose synthase
VAYGRGAGVDTRWLVIDCSLPFLSVTKRLHNRLHGVAGYDGDLGDDARAVYAEVQERNLRALEALVRHRAAARPADCGPSLRPAARAAYIV